MDSISCLWQLLPRDQTPGLSFGLLNCGYYGILDYLTPNRHAWEDLPVYHEEWSDLRNRVVAVLPYDIPSPKEAEWKEFEQAVLRELRPAMRPENIGEWICFRTQALAHMLIRPWLDSIYVSQDPITWTKLIKQLPPTLQSLTSKGVEAAWTTLRPVHAYPPANVHEHTYFEIKRQLWEKNIAWMLTSQEVASRKKKEEARKGQRSEPSPESKPELLAAVYVQSEWRNNKESEWARRILRCLPVDRQPNNTREWMELDCQVLSEMPLQPRLNSEKQLTPEWRAVETRWEEWQKLTAWKLLARHSVHMAEPEMTDPDVGCYNQVDMREQYEDEWSKRIYTQLPYNLRPTKPEEWFSLDTRIGIQRPGKYLEEDAEDWEKLLAWRRLDIERRL